MDILGNDPPEVHSGPRSGCPTQGSAQSWLPAERGHHCPRLIQLVLGKFGEVSRSRNIAATVAHWNDAADTLRKGAQRGIVFSGLSGREVDLRFAEPPLLAERAQIGIRPVFRGP